MEVSDPPGPTPPDDAQKTSARHHLEPHAGDLSYKYPGQPRTAIGQFDFGKDPNRAVQEANLRQRLRQLLRRPPKPSEQPLQDILKPGGREVGLRHPGAGEGIRTVTDEEFELLKSKLLDGAVETPAPKGYEGKWFKRRDGTIIGLRESEESGLTLEVVEGRSSGLPNGYKVHRK